MFTVVLPKNDMKIAVSKNDLRGLILYRSLTPLKKRRHFRKFLTFSSKFELFIQNQQIQ